MMSNVLGLFLVARQHIQGGLARNGALGHADMMPAEEKLTIEVGDVNGVQVDHFHVCESCQGEVLEKFTADSSSSNEENLA